MKLTTKQTKKETRQSRYAEYLKTATWRDLRKEAIKLTPYCALCSKETDLHVHHRKYPTTLGTEPLEWLTVLCAKCHHKFHGKGKFVKKKKKKRKGINRKSRSYGGNVKVFTAEEIVEYSEGYREETHG